MVVEVSRVVATVDNSLSKQSSDSAELVKVVKVVSTCDNIFRLGSSDDSVVATVVDKILSQDSDDEDFLSPKETPNKDSLESKQYDYQKNKEERLKQLVGYLNMEYYAFCRFEDLVKKQMNTSARFVSEWSDYSFKGLSKWRGGDSGRRDEYTLWDYWLPASREKCYHFNWMYYLSCLCKSESIVCNETLKNNTNVSAKVADYVFYTEVLFGNIMSDDFRSNPQQWRPSGEKSKRVFELKDDDIKACCYFSAGIVSSNYPPCNGNEQISEQQYPVESAVKRFYHIDFWKRFQFFDKQKVLYRSILKDTLGKMDCMRFDAEFKYSIKKRLDRGYTFSTNRSTLVTEEDKCFLFYFPGTVMSFDECYDRTLINRNEFQSITNSFHHDECPSFGYRFDRMTFVSTMLRAKASTTIKINMLKYLKAEAKKAIKDIEYKGDEGEWGWWNPKTKKQAKPRPLTSYEHLMCYKIYRGSESLPVKKDDSGDPIADPYFCVAPQDTCVLKEKISYFNQYIEKCKCRLAKVDECLKAYEKEHSKYWSGVNIVRDMNEINKINILNHIASFGEQDTLVIKIRKILGWD